MSCYPAHPFVPSLFQQTTDWFDRAKAALLDNLPCQKGCHHCCIGVFPITVLDQRELQHGLRSLPLNRRQAIQQAASDQVAAMTRSHPRLAEDRFLDRWTDEDIDRVVEQYKGVPCPALQEDGSCGLYQYRPLTCRSMGIPTEADGRVDGACAVQTSVPVIRLPLALRQEEDSLAKTEAAGLASMHRETACQGEEIFLPFAFLQRDGQEQTA